MQDSESLGNDEREAFLEACAKEGISENDKIVELIRQYLNKNRLP